MSVSNDFENEASGRPEVLQAAQEDFSCMIVICKASKAKVVTEEEAQFAEAYAGEDRANMTYDNGWNCWTITWYTDKQVGCFCEHDIQRLVQFLIENQMYYNSDLSK
ncbi:hypothetical protein G6F42_024008 [Rhizopus arrhizus]|nr:hypothetical protein G6F42_024008 [Rhizopus arrhizus]